MFKKKSWTNWLHRSVPSSASILLLTYSGIISKNTSKIPKNFQKSRRFRKIENRFFSDALGEGSCSNLETDQDETSK